MWPLLQLGPNVITGRTFITHGFKCYYGWDFYYVWVQMLLQMGPLLHLGAIITLVPSTGLPPPIESSRLIIMYFVW